MSDGEKHHRLLTALNSSELNSSEVITQLQELALSIEAPGIRARALTDLVEALSQRGKWDLGEKFAALIEDPYPRSLALAQLALKFSVSGNGDASQKFKEAELAARQIEDVEDQSWVLYRISTALAESGQLEESSRVAKTITDAYHRASALNKIAASYLTVNSLEHALPLLAEAETSVETGDVDQAWQRGEALARTAKTLSDANKKAEAMRVWDKAISYAQAGEESDDLQTSMDSSSVLREIARGLKSAGMDEKAEEVKKSIKHKK